MSQSIPRYDLSSNLIGHQADVKAVTFPNSHTIASVSRDGSVNLWKPKSGEPTSWLFKQLYHGQAYVNSVAWFDDSETRK